MPRIDIERPGYLPDPPERKPSSDQAFYHSPAWRKMRRIHLTGNPLCAACEARGLLTDCTRYRIGAIDHIVAIGAGGAVLHPLNLMTLCASCHNVKSALERHGLALSAYGEDGERLPGNGERERVIQLINSYKI
jgi:hypothetical protein